MIKLVADYLDESPRTNSFVKALEMSSDPSIAPKDSLCRWKWEMDTQGVPFRAPLIHYLKCAGMDATVQRYNVVYMVTFVNFTN